MEKRNFWSNARKSAALLPDVPADWADVRPSPVPKASESHSDVTLLPWTVTDGGNAPVPMPKYAPATFPDINRPGAKAPSDQELNFDPKGSGEWNAGLHHPIAALWAKEMVSDALGKTGENFENIHSNEADAFRHAYASYMVAKRFGADVARFFGNAHEISVPNEFGERYRDLYNNKVGRDLSTSRQGDPVSVIRDAVRRGWTRNSAFSEK